MALGTCHLALNPLPRTNRGGGKMRPKIHPANLAAIIAVYLWTTSLLSGQDRAFAGRAALGSPPVATRDRIFVGRAEPAQKVTVAAGEGHFPVACILKNGD